MSRGLKNFVLSDDTSMDEAMAAARNETDREQTAHQLDAFHKTFNFCMSCRQYTCGNCWNEADGRCLSCAPHLGHEILPAPFSNIGAGGAIALTDNEAIGLNDRNGHDQRLRPRRLRSRWPGQSRSRWHGRRRISCPSRSWLATAASNSIDSHDDGFDFAARLASVAGPAAGAIDDVAVEGALEREVAAAPSWRGLEFAAAAEVAAAEEIAVLSPRWSSRRWSSPRWSSRRSSSRLRPTPTAGRRPRRCRYAPARRPRRGAPRIRSHLFQRFRPGQSIDDEIQAYERAKAAESAAKAAAAALQRRRPCPRWTGRSRSIGSRTCPGRNVRAGARRRGPKPSPSRSMRPQPAGRGRTRARRGVAAAGPASEPRVDVVPQPTWQITAPDAPRTDGVPAARPAADQPAVDAVAAERRSSGPSIPQWPDRDASTRPAVPRPASPPRRAASRPFGPHPRREVARVSDLSGAAPTAIKPGGVQPCVSCGLSLSANARFCRRCGTRQGLTRRFRSPGDRKGYRASGSGRSVAGWVAR